MKLWMSCWTLARLFLSPSTLRLVCWLVGWCDMTYDVVVCACMCVTCMLVSVECWVLGNASWLLSVVYGVWSSGLASTRRSGWLAVNVKFVVSLVEGGIMIDVTVCKCVSFRLGL